MASEEPGIGLKIMLGISMLIIASGLIMKCKKSFEGEGSSGGGDNPFSCGIMEKWSSDDDVFNALQGTWVMENEDYYGSYKIQFTGRGGHRWKKEAGGSEWVDGGDLKLFEIKKYEHTTKMNQGPEYLVRYDSDLGTMSFDINCISGLTIASDRYPQYGIAFIKQ